MRKAIADACATSDGHTAVDAVLAQLGGSTCSTPRHATPIDIVFTALGDAECHGDRARRRGRVGARHRRRAPTSPSCCRAFASVGAAGPNRRGPASRAGARDGARRHGARDARRVRSGTELCVADRSDRGRGDQRGARDRSRCRLPRGPRARVRRWSPSGSTPARGKRPSRSAGARSRTRSRVPAAPCSRSRAPTRWSGCSSVVRSRGSRPCATGSPTRSWRSRRSRRR